MSDFPQPAPDFSQPLEALRACHERIRSQCGTLRRLVAHMQDHGCDDQARQAAGAVMRYFDTAARHHHADEEEDLLPRMMAAATVGRGSKLTRLIADIATEHKEMSRVWTELRAVLQEISVGENTILDPLNVDRFVKLNHCHIVMEEANVYPLAEMLLSRDDLAEIGSSMAQRRGQPG
ncbi:MAG: hemerythrin domain-containing protein [Betaproteobacteria bacterium]|nr:hemerythrin domain-containing protein [Betaproteobacteria bacterium]